MRQIAIPCKLKSAIIEFHCSMFWQNRNQIENQIYSRKKGS